ncbi:hypothetical protein NDU88_002216 [Pleurodeles waltl]|uniref:Uncharacterized protein n=1 Tax=Pleurodeles waltl TaxID=8319 RepID=A0AAV7ND36_PLEWA|nr:hypothetical protein NDU88_002216 [Pleurodeles waltl]
MLHFCLFDSREAQHTGDEEIAARLPDFRSTGRSAEARSARSRAATPGQGTTHLQPTIAGHHGPRTPRRAVSRGRRAGGAAAGLGSAPRSRLSHAGAAQTPGLQSKYCLPGKELIATGPRPVLRARTRSHPSQGCLGLF